MKKKALAAVCTACILCASLCGCTGYSSHSAIPDDNDDNLALTASAVLLKDNGKVKKASKLVDGNAETGCFVPSFSGTVEIDFGGEKTFNTIALREKGWNIRYYHIQMLEKKDGNESWKTIYEGERIEALRYCALETPVTTSAIRICVDKSNQPFTLGEVEVYNRAPVQRDDFFVTAYLRTETMLTGEMYDEQSTNHIPLEYFNSVNEINFLGNVGLTADGTIELTKPSGDGESVPMSIPEMAAQVQKLREYIGERDVQITMTVNTGEHEQAYKAMSEKQEELLDNTIDMIVQCGFDGVSYDWEKPQNKAQFDAFSDYLIALRPRLDEHDKRLTLAWAAWGVDMKEDAIKAADAIEIMSYDLFDQYGNQASFTESTVQAVEYFLSIGYDADQLHVGLPYYGRPDNGAEVWPVYDDERYKFGKFNDADNDFISDGLSYFNSYQTIADKTAYAIDRGLGGVMIFRLELDKEYDDETCLTKAIEKTVNSRIVKGGDK